ncbi:hypothetical protein Gorai_006548, partial [Gossypium raimondii]|nr:hypothetical protein [Gossypium raimondii]
LGGIQECCVDLWVLSYCSWSLAVAYGAWVPRGLFLIFYVVWVASLHEKFGWLKLKFGFVFLLLMEEINKLLGRLHFSEEEFIQVVSTSEVDKIQSCDSWAVGKIMAKESPNREVMYRVFKSLWFTKEEVEFVALKEGKGKGMDSYEFRLVPFWVRIYNIPIKLMDRQTALDVGNAIGVLVAIDGNDRFGGWIEFIRIKVKIDIEKPLRRVVRFVDKDGSETIGLIKYERLPDFCFSCGIIGHTLKTCTTKVDEEELNDMYLQFGSWMRAPIASPNQVRYMRRNWVEAFKPMTQSDENKEDNSTNWRNDGMGKSKNKRKRQKSSQGDSTDESPAKLVKRRLADIISPLKAVA